MKDYIYVRQNIWNYCFSIFVTSDFGQVRIDSSIYGHVIRLHYMLYF